MPFGRGSKNVVEQLLTHQPPSIVDGPICEMAQQLSGQSIDFENQWLSPPGPARA